MSRCNPASADKGALYDKILDIDLSCLSPMLAVPHKVDNVHPVTDYEGSAIDMAVIGTCTNGSFEDLETAAEILRTNALAEGVKFLVVPPSRNIPLKALEKGLISLFVEKGGTIVPPGCGPCYGVLNGVLLLVETDTGSIKDGDMLLLDLGGQSIVLRNVTRGEEYYGKGMPRFLGSIVESGGLIPYLSENGGFGSLT